MDALERLERAEKELKEVRAELKKQSARGKLDYDEPIIAIGDGYECLLMYREGTGFDWWCIGENCWNSRVGWQTRKEAVEAYEGLEVRNAELMIKEQ